MCASLTAEEYRLQPNQDVSPPWWNLGHTSWFFARNVLAPLGGRHEPEDEQYDYVLNSYYVSLGRRLPRSQRGSLSRPTTEEIYRYRASVDKRVANLVETVDDERLDELAFLLTVGIHHEQQHQELFYTEIKCILAQNPRQLRRPYVVSSQSLPAQRPVKPGHFQTVDGGLFEFGHQDDGWCWDNELPVHRQYLSPFELEDRMVTSGEFLEFVEDGGYQNALLWLDNGWREVEGHQLRGPLYWEQIDRTWWIWTLSGMRRLTRDEPVCHVSFYEAEAFARWKSATFDAYRAARLPTEREWERAARVLPGEPCGDAFLGAHDLHPAPATSGDDLRLRQMHGVLWQWTNSYYEPYPGYRPFPGVLAEYNGKFMDNQRVLRGGSCVTPRDHYRISYRNFWPPQTRFQFTGIRLARDASE